MSAHWALPGAKCVCIDDEFGEIRTSGGILPTRQPMLNEVLTVCEVIATHHPLGVYLAFIEIPLHQEAGGYSGKIYWLMSNFRPLVERRTDISIFTSMLTDQRQKEPI